MSESSTSRRSWTAAVTIGLAAAFLFCGYECVRSTSNTLFKAAYGKQNLPVVMALMPLGLVAALYGYGRLLSWVGPRKTLLATTLFSALSLGVCYGAIHAGWKPATGILYILREVYVVLVLEQYWSFLNSTLGLEAAKKLNGPICGIGSAGSFLGGLAVGAWSKPLGSETMLFFGAAALLPAAFIANLAYARCGEPARAAEEDRPTRGHLGLGLFRAHPKLVLLFLVILATQVVSTALDLSFQNILQDEIPDVDEQNAISGYFYAGLSAAAALGQLALTPLLLRFASFDILHLGMPLIHLAVCFMLIQDPNLITAGGAYLIFKVLDYSVFRAAKEILYIPFSFDVRYRAKEIIDVFGYRFGKGGLSLAITLFQQAGGVISAATYGLLAAGGAAVWLALIVPLAGPAYAAQARPRKEPDQTDGALTTDKHG